jgi:hypothetical protein
MRLGGRRGTSLLARRGGRHSACHASCGPADFWELPLPRRWWCLAATFTRPAALAQLVRPPPDGRLVRYPAARPGAARMVEGDKHLGASCSAIPGERCNTAAAPGPCACEHTSTAHGAPAALRGTARSAAQAAGVASQPGGGPSTPSAGRHANPTRTGLTPKAARPQGAPFSGDARRRVARSRGAPQRGRRARNSATRCARPSLPESARRTADPKREGRIPFAAFRRGRVSARTPARAGVAWPARRRTRAAAGSAPTRRRRRTTARPGGPRPRPSAR